MSVLVTRPGDGDERMGRLSTTLALLPLVLVAAAGTFANLNNYLVAACAAVLADQFVRLAVRHGDLGWRRLRLPARRLPLWRTPPRQAQAAQPAESGARPALVFVGKHSLSEGGEMLVYKLRSQQTGVWSDQRT